MKIIGNKIKNNYILITILFLGLILRIYNLGTESFWCDEGFSSMISRSSLFQIAQQTSQDSHPPLYYFILHYWINLFGVTEFSIRFLSVIFGFFAILMIYMVGTLIFNKNVGIISSLILALSAFHIYYSQEARMYSLMTLLTLLSIYFFIKLINGGSFKFIIGYILSSILLMYTHYFGLVMRLSDNPLKLS
jgi:mannosyltransferase